MDKDAGKAPKPKSKSQKSTPKTPKASGGVNVRWICTIMALSFVLSVLMSFTSDRALKYANVVAAFLILLAFIAVGIVFDIVGVAATASSEKRFHSMAARKVHGAKQAIWIVRNAEKVGSFCNDVVGDICGIISGATGAVIIERVARGEGLPVLLTSLGITGTVAALTIGGKAIGKTFGISKSEDIVFAVGRLMHLLHIKR